MKQSEPPICIFGAGSIGCYIGGRLAATGATVRFIGRERLAKDVAAHGLHLTDYRGLICVSMQRMSTTGPTRKPSPVPR